MMERYTIEPLQENHVEAVYDISCAAFPLPWSRDDLRREIQNSKAINLVILSEGQVAGYLQCWYSYEDADLINIAVHPDFRRRHLAQALLLHLINLLKKKDVENVFLEVRVSNLPAQLLYRSLGFITLSRRPRYYINGEDALVMNLQI